MKRSCKDRTQVDPIHAPCAIRCFSCTPSCPLLADSVFVGYDGGDCCSCTCVPPEEVNGFGDFQGCDSGFACVDPEAPRVDDDDITVDVVEECEFTVNVGDGFCQLDLNTPACSELTTRCLGVPTLSKGSVFRRKPCRPPCVGVVAM